MQGRFGTRLWQSRNPVGQMGPSDSFGYLQRFYLPSLLRLQLAPVHIQRP